MAMRLLMSTRLSAIVGACPAIFMNLLLDLHIKKDIFMQLFQWPCDLSAMKDNNPIAAKQLRSARMVVMNGSIMVYVLPMALAWVWMMKYSNAITRESGFRQINLFM